MCLVCCLLHISISFVLYIQKKHCVLYIVPSLWLFSCFLLLCCSSTRTSNLFLLFHDFAILFFSLTANKIKNAETKFSWFRHRSLCLSKCSIVFPSPMGWLHSFNDHICLELKSCNEIELWNSCLVGILFCFFVLCILFSVCVLDFRILLSLLVSF